MSLRTLDCQSAARRRHRRLRDIGLNSDATCKRARGGDLHMYEHNRGRLEKRRCARCMATGSWHAQKQHTRFRVRRVFTCISAVYICMLQKCVAWSCELSAGVRCPQSSHFFVRMPTAAVGQQEPFAASTNRAGDRLLGCASACRTHMHVCFYVNQPCV